MKKLLAGLLAGCMIVMNMSGCAQFLSFDERDPAPVKPQAQTAAQNQGQETPETQADPGQAEQEGQEAPENQMNAPDNVPGAEPAPEIKPAQSQDAPTGTTLSAYTFGGDWRELPNDPVSFGYDFSSREEGNRPEGVTYYRNNYEGYGADFIQNTEEQKIYLTFNCSYEEGNADAILDTLSSRGVRAVFFVNRGYASENPSMIERIIGEGHRLGNRASTNPENGIPGMGADAAMNDILSLHDLVSREHGYEMSLFRFPDGTFSPQSLAMVHDLGYHSVFWTFEYRDWSLEDQPDPQTALDTMLNSLHNGAIYLLRIESSTNAQVLGSFIDQVRSRGYEFGTYPAH